jgi:hypothetical protein
MIFIVFQCSETYGLFRPGVPDDVVPSGKRG